MNFTQKELAAIWILQNAGSIIRNGSNKALRTLVAANNVKVSDEEHRTFKHPDDTQSVVRYARYTIKSKLPKVEKNGSSIRPYFYARVAI